MELETYLQDWDRRNAEEHRDVQLFQPESVRTLTRQQKQHFAQVFYHIRGHFHDFLWLVGNRTPDKRTRDAILENIHEEWGGDYGKSHERLYFDFAQSLGVDVSQECWTEESYLPFTREFNRGHLRFLATSDWDSVYAALSAYERLDNVDYADLEKMAKAMGTGGDALLFFTVHSQVEHFDMVSQDLEPIWNRNPEAVRNGYEFIGRHQNRMWRNLSDEVFR